MPADTSDFDSGVPPETPRAPDSGVAVTERGADAYAKSNPSSEELTSEAEPVYASANPSEADLVDATQASAELAPAETAETGHLELPTAESWGNLDTLADHTQRHGPDFGTQSPDQYAGDASAFLQRAAEEGLPVKVDDQGVIRAYDPDENVFGSYSADGTTRTYFKPDPAEHGRPTNLDYWNDQPGTSPWEPTS